MRGGYWGHRKDEWTDYELQLLYEHVHDRDYLAKLCPVIDRSRSAIEQRMRALRREAELPIVPPGPEILARMARELAESDGFRHKERATDAANARRPDTSEG